MKKHILAGILLYAIFALGCIEQKGEIKTQNLQIGDKYSYTFG